MTDVENPGLESVFHVEHEGKVGVGGAERSTGNVQVRRSAILRAADSEPGIGIGAVRRKSAGRVV